MNQRKLEELALGHALGTLDNAEQRELERLVRNDADASAEVSSYIDTVAAFAAAASPAVEPRAEVRARIFASVARTPQLRRHRIASTTTTTQPSEAWSQGDEKRELVTAGGGSAPPSAAGVTGADHSPFTVIINGSDGWTETDVPGFRTKLLSSGPQAGSQVMLLAFDPGVGIPDHQHPGCEEIYMLTGHLCTGGVTLGPGDYYRAEAGSLHEGVYSEDGCTALLICGPHIVSAE